jgi:chromosome segregation ATPase
MRVDKALAEKRALRAEAESAKCLAMAETASVKQVEQLEAAASEREELIKKIDALSFALSQSESGRASAEHTMRILSEQIPALSTRFETSAGALAKTEAQVSLLVARGAELERLLTSKAAEAEALRGAAIAAEERQASALISLRGCEDSLANAHARCQALETTEREQTRTTEVLKRELETAGQARAISEAELTSLRDELSRRPPIDVIKELDVENLLQRNMQAAAAMGQLLAWQSSHVPKPVAGLDANR